jgi:hypothetical protein
MGLSDLKPHIFLRTKSGNVLKCNVPNEIMTNLQNKIDEACNPINDSLKNEDHVLVLVTQNEKDTLFTQQSTLKKALHIGSEILISGTLMAAGGAGMLFYLIFNINS